MDHTLLKVEDLTVQFRTQSGLLTAVSNASFDIETGEYFGIAGESGCGKSTLAKAIVGLLDDNGVISSGVIRYKGEEIQDMSSDELSENLRWKEISFIPQSSMDSLDPLQRIRNQAIEIAKVHDVNRQEALDHLGGLLEMMGIDKDRMNEYPHQFSGGMQQRVVIALSLFLKPSLIIADEPTTALDVIMQDQIFRHLDDMKEGLDTSMMMITHDISVIFENCDKGAIMHGGQIAETGTIQDLYHSPRHPYSILLQEAFPDIRHPNHSLEVIKGNPPKSIGEINRCSFVDRCPWAINRCREGSPDLEPIENEMIVKNPHKAACIRKHEVHTMYKEDK